MYINMPRRTHASPSRHLAHEHCREAICGLVAVICDRMALAVINCGESATCYNISLAYGIHANLHPEHGILYNVGQLIWLFCVSICALILDLFNLLLVFTVPFILLLLVLTALKKTGVIGT